MAGHQLPLCARDLGLFGGLLVATTLLAWIRELRWRPIWLLGPLLMMGDGLNSLGGGPLYQPNNGFRLASGLIAGISLVMLLLPLIPMPRARGPLAGVTLTLGLLALVGLFISPLLSGLSVGLAGTGGAALIAMFVVRLMGGSRRLAVVLIAPELVGLAMLKQVAIAVLA
ncbi:MAG: DUF2085 domain-containing protein [Chloroflexi bacterium]|nr:DUF2085 domain-containing protein [Chloroflexota bacterium]